MSPHGGRFVFLGGLLWLACATGNPGAPTAAQECYNWHRNKVPSPAAWGRKSAAISRALAREET